MNEQTPTHLISTLQLVERAYPQGVPQSDYLALLFVLSEHLCEENLAIVASSWNTSEGSRLNDVLTAKHQQPNADSVIKKLKEAGYDEWSEEE